MQFEYITKVPYLWEIMEKYLELPFTVVKYLKF